MLEAAGRRQFDVLLVWRYDRFARSMRELVNALAEFERLGIDFISYNEGADTTTPQGRLLFGIMASSRGVRALADRRAGKAGMQRAKAQGKHTGRPRLPEAKRKAIVELWGRGAVAASDRQEAGRLARDRAAHREGLEG